jgi:hypothetical protein
MPPKIISYKDGLTMLEKENNLLFVIEYNLCKVFKTGKRFLIMPTNPFGNALVVDSEVEIYEFEKIQHFPDGNEQQSLYYLHKTEIETQGFFELKEIKLQSLLAQIKKSTSKFAAEISMDNPDSVHFFLRKTNALKNFKLAFLFLLGDHLIQQFGRESMKWGIVQTKLTINPYRSFVILNSLTNEYLDIEFSVFGKWGYQQFCTISHSVERYTMKVQPPLVNYYRIF